jgi:hypothetical protein
VQGAVLPLLCFSRTTIEHAALSLSRMLLSLPREVIDEILEEVVDGRVDRDLFALTRICKALVPAVIRVVYREIEIIGLRQMRSFQERVPLSTRRVVRSLRLLMPDCVQESEGECRGVLAGVVISSMPSLRKLHLGPLANTAIEALVSSGELSNLRYISVVNPLTGTFKNTVKGKRALLNACADAQTVSLQGAVLPDDVSDDSAVVSLAETHPRLAHLKLSMAFMLPKYLFVGLRLESLTLEYMTVHNLEMIAPLVGPTLGHLRLGERGPLEFDFF